MIKACSWLLLMDEKEKIQAKLIKRGLSKDLYICNVLIAMQFKLGFVENGESLFKDMMVKDLVSWNSMISGYVSIGDDVMHWYIFAVCRRLDWCQIGLLSSVHLVLVL